MWILGIAFIVSSAFVYFLFLAAWLNLFIFLGLVVWVRVIIALVALVAGVLNLKELLENKSGCKVMGDEKRQKVFEKIKNITSKKSFILALSGIILLAFGGIVKSVNIEKNDEKIIYKIYPTLSMAKMAFLMGEIDVIQNISTNPFEYETEWQQTTDIISKQENNIHIGLFFNLENDLFKDNKALRQALAYATRKPKDESRATGPIARTSWAYNLDVKIYDFEPKRANELAEKSLGNIEKVRAMQLKISTTNSLLSLAEEIKRDWEEVFGCNVEIEVINTIQPDYQILLTAQEIPEDPDQYALWHSTQSWPGNIINLKNLRIDKLLEDGRTEIDTKVRKDYYFEFQKYFVEEVPVLFLYYPNYYTIVRKNTVKNVLIDILQKGRRMSQSVETTE